MLFVKQVLEASVLPPGLVNKIFFDLADPAEPTPYLVCMHEHGSHDYGNIQGSSDITNVMLDIVMMDQNTSFEIIDPLYDFVHNTINQQRGTVSVPGQGSYIIRELRRVRPRRYPKLVSGIQYCYSGGTYSVWVSATS